MNSIDLSITRLTPWAMDAAPSGGSRGPDRIASEAKLDDSWVRIGIENVGFDWCDRPGSAGATNWVRFVRQRGPAPSATPGRPAIATTRMPRFVRQRGRAAIEARGALRSRQSATSGDPS